MPMHSLMSARACVARACVRAHVVCVCVCVCVCVLCVCVCHPEARGRVTSVLRPNVCASVCAQCLRSDQWLDHSAP